MKSNNNSFGADSGDTQSVGSSGSRASRPRLSRASSFAVMKDSFMWLGEQAQTQFLDRNLEAHTADDDRGDYSPLVGSVRPASSISSIPNIIMHRSSYNSLDYFSTDKWQTIRFQVIVWSIGSPDVKNGLVSMKFRVTLFWNDQPTTVKKKEDAPDNLRRRKHSIWVMSGRSAAYKKKISESTSAEDMIDVPPISILNAESFDIIGQPEVQLLREDTRLMRWSCMYRAKLHQDEIHLANFPHDTHHLTLKLGILSQRQPGGRWDRRKWKLALANESDTRGSIRIPYGLIVDHVRIPEFEADYKSGLEFGLSELKHGSSSFQSSTRDQDFYLSVKLKVKRDSGYYDKNIMPLLSFLNIVSISILTLDADNYFQRGLMSLNIAFVEVGLRLTLDNHLPNVSYQIKMQRILNFFFYSILSIVLESSVLKFLIENGVCSVESTRKIDFVWVIILLANQAFLQLVYTSFDQLRQWEQNLAQSEIL